MTPAGASHRRRLSTEARRMLPWCIALAAAVHVILLSAMAPEPPMKRSGGWAPRAGRHPGRPIAVRLVAQASLPADEHVAVRVLPDIVQAPPDAADAASAPPSAPASAASAPAQAMPDTASLAASGPASAAVATAQASSAPDRAAGAEVAGDAGDQLDGSYVPRPLLSIAPEVTAPVVVAPPASSASTGQLIGRYTGVLALYIDEQGVVRRIEPEAPALPEPMAQAARAAFMNAHFSPGQMDGHAVKSRIRVEVVFDDTPQPAASASAAGLAASRASSASSAASVARDAGAQRPR